MSYQKDRDEFIAVIVSEVIRAPATLSGGRRDLQGMNLARLILRNAATIQRCEELLCSSEAVDRNRVACPASKSGRDEDCCCDYKWHQQHGRDHGETPRVQVAILRACQRIEAACKPWGIKPNFNGDPRGACVKLLLPSGRWNSFGGKEYGWCGPTR